VSRAPGLPEARLVLARALVAQRELTRADAEIARLLATYPRASAVHALKGTVFLLKSDPAAARVAFQRAFDLDPDSIAALTGLTMLDMQERRPAAARSRVEERLARQPDRVGLAIVAAKVYASTGDLVNAERTLKRTIALAPTSPEAFVLLGEVYRAQQRLEPARAKFDAAVERNPADIASRTMAAMLVHAQQKPGEAKARYARLLEIEPRAAVAANNLAWIYADEQQNLDVALQLAERAAEQMPDYAEALDTLGWVYYRKQLPLLAVEPFERAVEKDPENAAFHYHLGMALAASGDRVRSRTSLQTALKLQPEFPEARKELAALER
jgi:tetratricopeptide (TPR) repeat protein